MDTDRLNLLLKSVAEGTTSIAVAADQIKQLPYEDIDFAHIDHHRSLRKGFPEVIFGQGKSTTQIIGMIEKMIPQESTILVTRVEAHKAEKITSLYKNSFYDPDARIILVGEKKAPLEKSGEILVISAESSDIHVAKGA